MSSRSERRSAAALFACLALGLVTGCTVPEAQTDPTTDRSATGGAADTSLAGSGGIDESLLRRRNATIRTGLDTYVVRNVSFNTADGFGGANAMMGHYNGTVWQFELRFIRSIDVVGTIDASEARSAPDNYFARDELDLRKTFRTRLTKTDGETVDFVVRINSIGGALERGGTLQLSLEELATLRSIEFF
jgi:hypothetical protein